MAIFTDLIPEMQQGKKINYFIGKKTCYFFPYEIRDGVMGYEYEINLNERRTNKPVIERDFVDGFPRAYINGKNWAVVV